MCLKTQFLYNKYMNKNLVIFSGSRNQIDDYKLNLILKEIGSKIDNNVYDVWYGVVNREL